MTLRINYLNEALNAIYDLNMQTECAVKQYFSEHYEQLVNGESKNLDEFITHVNSQKQNLAEIHFDFKQALASDDAIFAIYYPRGRNHQGNIIEAEVIAYYQFLNDKITYCHAQVRLLIGVPSDVDMGEA